MIDRALERLELSARELAITLIDERAQFVSEASVYRLLGANGLLTGPAFIVMKATDAFRDKTTVPNQLWQTDFTHLKVAGDLASWLGEQGIAHVRGAPNHPMIQGKIERWHQTPKNRILLEHYFLPGYLERQIAAFVDHDNHRRYHESLSNLTPADVYLGRGLSILQRREEIKPRTIDQRRLQHHQAAA